LITDGERANRFEDAIRIAFRGMQAGIWTALPGIVTAFDKDSQTASVQPAVQAYVTDKDGVQTWVNLPLLVDCPVFFARGNGSSITLPVAVGDECLVVFASRCIDAWWQSGGIQNQAELRMHDLSDGFVFVGFGSTPNALEDFSLSYIVLTALAGAIVRGPQLTVEGNVTVGTGASGSFTTTTGAVITVRNGIITDIGT
jgi:hypothetical protein